MNDMDISNIVNRSIEDALRLSQKSDDWSGRVKHQLCEMLNIGRRGADDVVRPKMSLLIPVLQMANYVEEETILYNMLVNLLMSIFCKNLGALAHPSFVSILSQLAEDEAYMMKYVYKKDAPIPLITLRIKFRPNGGSVDFFRHLSALNEDVPELGCRTADSMIVCLDNLSRLNLINIHEDRKLTDESCYERIRKSRAFLDVKSRIKLDEETEWDELKMFFDLTEFGKQFCRLVFRGNSSTDKAA